MKLSFVAALLWLAPSLHAFDTEQWLSSHEKEVREASQSREWKRVLHYSPHWFRQESSLVDGPEYFFSPNGQHEPFEELVASIRRLNDPAAREKKAGKLDQPLRCAFPFRTQWLSRRFQLDFPPLGKCELLESFLAKSKAKSLSLIFSSAYANNPSSMFGHSLLKLNAKGESELLDYGINFAANVSDNENPFAFIWFGLTGGYLGQFSMVPYYEKIREYVDSENRDLWEYELNLTPDEVRSLVLHLWELETVTWFDYFFADENCSFHVLRLLEILRPEWKLTDNGVFSVPGETLKRLNRTPGAVVGKHYRPSFRQIFFRHVERLSPEQENSLKELADAAQNPKDVKDAETLEAYAAWLKYKKPKHPDEEWERKFQQTLMARSQLGGKTPDLNIPVPVDREPNQGHSPYRLSVGVGLLRLPQTVGYQQIQVRFPYHDLINDDRGFVPFSEIQGINAVLRVNSLRSAGETRSLVTLDRFQGLAVTSLAPVSYWDRPRSWRFNLEFLQRHEFGLASAPGVKLEGALGWSIDSGFFRSRFAALFGARAELGSPIHRLGPQFEILWIASPIVGWKWKFRLETFYNVSAQGYASLWPSLQWEHAWALQENWELRAGCATTLFKNTGRPRSQLDCSVTGNYYF